MENNNIDNLDLKTKYWAMVGILATLGEEKLAMGVDPFKVFSVLSNVPEIFGESMTNDDLAVAEASAILLNVIDELGKLKG